MSGLLDTLLLFLVCFVLFALSASWWCRRVGMSHQRLWFSSPVLQAGSSSASPSAPSITTNLCMDQENRRHCPDRRSPPCPGRRHLDNGNMGPVYNG